MSYTTYEAMPLDQMLARVQKYHPGDSYKLVEKAYRFAEEAHAGQKRKSGEPYFTHPCFVASILTELMIDAPTIAAGLLHDTVEDCENITLETIQREFGQEVARLVDGVTKLNKLDFADREEAAGREPAQDDPGHEPRTSAWCSSSWRTGCITCVP